MVCTVAERARFKLFLSLVHTRVKLARGKPDGLGTNATLASACANCAAADTDAGIPQQLPMQPSPLSSAKTQRTLDHTEQTLILIKTKAPSKISERNMFSSRACILPVFDGRATPHWNNVRFNCTNLQVSKTAQAKCNNSACSLPYRIAKPSMKADERSLPAFTSQVEQWEKRGVATNVDWSIECN